MNSREKILKEIAAAKPGSLPLPDTFQSSLPADDILVRFIQVLESIGGSVRRVESLEVLDADCRSLREAGSEVVCGVEGLASFNGGRYAGRSAAELERVHSVWLKGSLAVAENGSVWLPERAMYNRLLPFICERLVLVVEASSIVPHMHEAYDRIRISEDGYGVFIAGPSKTADIEQSLVIGAHGPLGLEVVLVGG